MFQGRFGDTQSWVKRLARADPVPYQIHIIFTLTLGTGVYQYWDKVY